MLAFNFESFFLFRPYRYFGSGPLGPGGGPSPRAGEGARAGQCPATLRADPPQPLHPQLQLAPHAHPLFPLSATQGVERRGSCKPGFPLGSPHTHATTQ